MAGYFLQRFNVAYGIYDVPLFYKPPRGPEIYFHLTYNNRESFQPANPAFSNLGRGWSFRWLMYLTTNTAVTRVYMPGIGVEDHSSGYPNPEFSNNQFVPNRFTRAHLIRLGPTHFERRTPSGAKYTFNLPGPGGTVFMTSMSDPTGNTVQFHFDSTYRLRAVTDAIGQVTTLDYELVMDPKKITRVTDPFGRQARLDYGTTGNLQRVTDMGGLVSEFIGTNGVTSFRTPYGTTRFETREFTDNLGNSNVVIFRQLVVTDPEGNTERLEFRGTGEVQLDVPSERTPAGMDGDNQFHSRRNTYYFDKRATRQGTTDASAAHIFHWMHAEDSRLISPILVWDKRPNENRTWYNYPTTSGSHQGHDPEEIRLAFPSIIGRTYSRRLSGDTTQLWRSEYNSAGNRISTTDPVGRQTRYIYASNQVDLLAVLAGPGASETNASFTYDHRHLRLTSTDASGQTTRYAYNSHGQVVAVTNPLGDVVRYDYDDDGYLRGIRGPIPGSTVGLTYDDFGRLRTVTDPDGDTRTIEFDALNRIIRIDYPDGTFEATGYDRLDPVQHRDRLGQWTHTTYNALRQPVQVVDPLGRTNSFGWCSCGSMDSLTDALGHTTVWERDRNSRVTAKVYADGSRIRYEYDGERGLLQRSIDAMNQITEYRYGLDNRLTNINYVNAIHRTPSVSLAYDAHYDRLTRMVDGVGTHSYVYHPISNPPDLGSGKLWQVDGPWENDTVVYIYDPMGRVVERSIAGVGQRFTFDPLGRVAETTNVLGRFSYDYVEATQRPKAIRYPNGIEILYEYFDEKGDHRLRTIHNRGPSGETLSRFDYGYDGLGRITTWSQQEGEDPPEVWDIGYDRASQLLNVTVHAGSEAGPVLKEYAYTYDAAGNRLSEQIDSVVNSAQHNPLNQLISLSPGGPMRVRGRVNEPSRVTVDGQPATMRSDYGFETSIDVNPGSNVLQIVAEDGSGNRRTNRYEVVVTNTPVTTFAYDLNGNTVMASNATSVTTYEWDAENRLVAVTMGTRRSEFRYDGMSRRVSITDRAASTPTADRRFIFCGIRICEERDGSNVTARRNYARGQQVLGESFFHTSDHLGSVRELVGSGAAVLTSYKYDPYGRPRRTFTEVPLDRTFTGHFAHEPTGLLLAPYRVYHADSGRWLSRDPIQEGDGPNLYGYAHNSPAIYIDPLGYAKLDSLGVACDVFFKLLEKASKKIPFDFLELIPKGVSWLGTFACNIERDPIQPNEPKNECKAVKECETGKKSTERFVDQIPSDVDGTWLTIEATTKRSCIGGKWRITGRYMKIINATARN